MPAASELKPDGRIVSLFVGDSGAGKSCAAAFFPKPIKWIAVTTRVAGIIGHPGIRGQEWLKQISIDYFDITKGFTGIDSCLEVMIAQGNKLPYKTVVFEDFTTTSEILQQDAFKFTSIFKKPEGGLMYWHPQLGRISLPGLGEFAYEDGAFKQICIALNCLPCHVIVMVHWTDRYEKNEVVGKKISLRNATIPKVVKWFNEIWYFERNYSKAAVAGKMVEKCDYDVVFENDLARTCFFELPKRFTWTDKNFFEEFSSRIKQVEIQK